MYFLYLFWLSGILLKRHASSEKTRSFQQNCAVWDPSRILSGKKLSWCYLRHQHAFSVPEKKEVTCAFRQEYLSKTHPSHPAELPGFAGVVLEEQTLVHRWHLPCSHQLYWNGSPAKETAPKFTVEEATCKWLSVSAVCKRMITDDSQQIVLVLSRLLLDFNLGVL